MKKLLKASLLMMATNLLVVSPQYSVAAEEKNDHFIKDAEIEGLVFKSAGDIDTDIPQEILDELQAKTGIKLKLETVTADSSIQGLTAGLAAGDLPDFIAFNLNNSGRPEMSLLLKAAAEGMFTDIKPYLEMDDLEVYPKYVEEGFLPDDSFNNIVFRPEHDGSTYLIHMGIDRNPGQKTTPLIGGAYIRADIVEDLNVDPQSIQTSEELYDLMTQIQEKEYTDANGKPITVLGPTIWGGYDRSYVYQDKVWTLDAAEYFMEDEDGNILHESQTPIAMERVNYVHQLINEGIMHPEFYTMEENRAKEGVINGSFAIVSDMHSLVPENQDLKYLPLGPIKRIDGSDDMILQYKSGYGGWAIPSTTEDPETVVRLMDFLSSKEGKLLWMYGIEGRDYDLDENGFPVIKEEVYQLSQENPEKAKELGFFGVGHQWGNHMGNTDIDNMADFGEYNWGENHKEAKEGKESAPHKIADIYNWEERHENARIIDGMSVRSFLYEYEGEDGKLAQKLDAYTEDLLKAYYATSTEEAQAILEASKKDLLKAGLEDFIKFVKEKKDSGTNLRF